MVARTADFPALTPLAEREQSNMLLKSVGCKLTGWYNTQATCGSALSTVNAPAATPTTHDSALIAWQMGTYQVGIQGQLCKRPDSINNEGTLQINRILTAASLKFL